MPGDPLAPDLPALVLAAPFPVYALDHPAARLAACHYTVDTEAQCVTSLSFTFHLTASHPSGRRPRPAPASAAPPAALALESCLLPPDFPYADLAAAAEWAVPGLLSLWATLHSLSTPALPPPEALPPALDWRPYPRHRHHPPFDLLETAVLPAQGTWFARRFHGPFTLLAVAAGRVRLSILDSLVSLKTAPDVLDRLSL